MTLVRTDDTQLKFRDVVRTFLPPWLRGPNAYPLSYIPMRMLDTIIDSQLAALRHRFPGLPVYSGGPPSYESLSLVGRDRGLIKGAILETNESYALRLRGWLDAHRHRGSTRELLRQIRAFHGDERFTVQVIARSGLRHTLLAQDPLTIVRDKLAGWSPDARPDLWSRVLTVIIQAEIYHLFLQGIDSYPPTEQARRRAAQARAISDLRSLIVDFSPAHIGEIRVVITQGGGLWDEIPTTDGSAVAPWDGGDPLWDSPADEATAPISFVIGPSV